MEYKDSIGPFCEDDLGPLSEDNIEPLPEDNIVPLSPIKKNNRGQVIIILLSLKQHCIYWKHTIEC